MSNIQYTTITTINKNYNKQFQDNSFIFRLVREKNNDTNKVNEAIKSHVFFYILQALFLIISNVLFGCLIVFIFLKFILILLLCFTLIYRSMTFWCFVVPHCCQRVGLKLTLTAYPGCWVLGLVVPHGSARLCGKVTLFTTHCVAMLRPIVSQKVWVIICIIITAITKISFGFLMSF